jgi:hypothetical protein
MRIKLVMFAFISMSHCLYCIGRKTLLAELELLLLELEEILEEIQCWRIKIVDL